MEANPLYVISGISGSGKTILGQLLAKQIKGSIFIDQDEFFIKDKPYVILSDGSRGRNWDCLESLSSSMTDQIYDLLLKQPVILVGFALCREVLPVIPKVHIHLITGTNLDDIEQRCVAARTITKPNNDLNRDKLMVKEVVIPFYNKIVANSDITHFISVFDNKGERIIISELIETINKIINVI